MFARRLDRRALPDLHQLGALARKLLLVGARDLNAPVETTGERVGEIHPDEARPGALPPRSGALTCRVRCSSFRMQVGRLRETAAASLLPFGCRSLS